MLYKNRERFDKLSVKLGIAFAKFGLTPNQWTLLSILPALGAAWLLAQGQFWEAAAAFLVAAVLDFVDGSVARVTGRVSKFGGYLDTVVDRYVEVLVVLGLMFAALPAVFGVAAGAWLLVYLFGAMMTTYAKAAAKEKELVKEELRGGILERAERLAVLFVGLLAAGVAVVYLMYVIVALAVLANVSALQRIMAARAASSQAQS